MPEKSFWIVRFDGYEVTEILHKTFTMEEAKFILDHVKEPNLGVMYLSN